MCREIVEEYLVKNGPEDKTLPFVLETGGQFSFVF